MEYTGLKDKNGKEIYVGDIVNYNPNSHLYDGRYYEVKFGEHLTSDDFYASLAYGFYLSSTHGEEEGEMAFNSKYVNNKINIIGNKYENPELFGEGETK